MRIRCRFLANSELRQLLCVPCLFLFFRIGCLCLHPGRKREGVPTFHARSDPKLVHVTAHVARARSRELPTLIAMCTWIAHVVSLFVRYRACIMHHRGLFDKEKGGCLIQPPILCGSEDRPRCRVCIYENGRYAFSASPRASRTRAASTSWPSSNVATVTKNRMADFISSRSAPWFFARYSRASSVSTVARCAP